MAVNVNYRICIRLAHFHAVYSTEDQLTMKFAACFGIRCFYLLKQANETVKAADQTQRIPTWWKEFH